ncbi:uncharacterized protein LOC109725836 isoform X2 [Ananas comosus]|uniref:Uncharacterized protein LOC109725836 isoform X2 n=1 Tax=Ananas comosus TaxID=4615 RepID=A0A6P5GQ71_ANACO|nr:uncharacterized protein LOC109725836 isoform X2 [Ananas comosus]
MDAATNPLSESLMSKHHPHQSTNKLSILRAFSCCSGKRFGGKKSSGGPRSDAEERVYTWLYALAKAEKNLIFEFVRSTKRGLSFKEAERRLKEEGQNIPVHDTFPSWWQLLWKAFLHPFNIILIVMATLSYVADDNANGCIMLILVLISVSIRFHQEYNSSKAAKQLSKLVRSSVRVQRCAGKIYQTELVVQIDQRNIVPGDIIPFGPGDLFPGDVRLITSKELVVSQSSLTGESGMTEKVADITEESNTSLLDLKNICFMGTSVISGCGTGLVISTGSNTYMSTIFSTLGKEKQPDAFEKGVRCISYTLICIMVVAVPIIILSDYWKSHNLSKSIVFGISVAVALTPQMFPLIVNTNLARGAIVMAKGRCIVKSASAIQKMGSMDILCIDKTGTLTMDRVIMVHHLDAWGFSNEIILRYVITKGALEETLNLCTSIKHVESDANVALTSEDRQRILRMNEELSNDGLRVLGVAMRRISKRAHTMAIDYRTVESGMIFLGIISFLDPPKDSAEQALWQLAERGVKAKVLTGDSLILAIKVCREVGISTTHVTTGPDLDLLDENKFHETIKRVTVLARLTPIQKLRVVQSLQKVGNHVVGYLGDGINDSLALDAADVAISVDSGASVAKNLADIILLEKDLNVLVLGVENGRLTYGNTMKYIKLSLVANISGAFSLLIVTIFLQFEPLTPKQLLTQNFLYNLGQIAIPWDKMEEGYAKNPQRWSSKELPIFMLWNGPVCSLFDIATFLLLWFYYGANKASASQFFHSAWFVEGLLMQALIIHMIRTQKIPFIQDTASWPVMLSTIAISAVGIIILFTPIGEVMGLIGLPLSYFCFLVLLFLGYFTLGQVVKKAYIMINQKWL